MELVIGNKTISNVSKISCYDTNGDLIQFGQNSGTNGYMLDILAVSDLDYALLIITTDGIIDKSTNNSINEEITYDNVTAFVFSSISANISLSQMAGTAMTKYDINSIGYGALYVLSSDVGCVIGSGGGGN